MQIQWEQEQQQQAQRRRRQAQLQEEQERRTALDEAFDGMAESGATPADIGAAFGRWADTHTGRERRELWDATNRSLDQDGLVINSTAAAAAVSFSGVLRSPAKRVAREHRARMPHGQKGTRADVEADVGRARQLATRLGRAVLRTLGGYLPLEATRSVSAAVLRAALPRAAAEGMYCCLDAAPATAAAGSATTPAAALSVSAGRHVAGSGTPVASGGLLTSGSVLSPFAADCHGEAATHTANLANVEAAAAARTARNEAEIARHVQFIVEEHCRSAAAQAQTAAAAHCVAVLLEGTDEVVEEIMVRSYACRITGATMVATLLRRQQGRVVPVMAELVAVSPVSAMAPPRYEFCLRRPWNSLLQPLLGWADGTPSLMPAHSAVLTAYDRVLLPYNNTLYPNAQHEADSAATDGLPACVTADIAGMATLFLQNRDYYRCVQEGWAREPALRGIARRVFWNEDLCRNELDFHDHEQVDREFRDHVMAGADTGRVHDVLVGDACHVKDQKWTKDRLPMTQVALFSQQTNLSLSRSSHRHVACYMGGDDLDNWAKHMAVNGMDAALRQHATVGTVVENPHARDQEAGDEEAGDQEPGRGELASGDTGGYNCGTGGGGRAGTAGSPTRRLFVRLGRC